MFFSHRTYARIVNASPEKGLDVLQVVTALTGRKRGVSTAVIYWLAIFPTVLIYGISITNTMDSFIVNQLHGSQLPRAVLATLCIGVLTAAFALGKKATPWFANIPVYPLIVALAAVSKFALDVQKARKGDVAATERQVPKIELITATLLLVFTMFFVWSCTLTLGAGGLEEARAQNIPVLSYFANVTNTPFMAIMTPIVAICDIASSHFGHMLGAEEGTAYLIRVMAPETAKRIDDRLLDYAGYLFVFVTGVVVAVITPSILDLISVVGGLFMTFLVYLVPASLFRKATAFRHYANRPDVLFVGVMGVVIMAVTVWQML